MKSHLHSTALLQSDPFKQLRKEGVLKKSQALFFPQQNRNINNYIECIKVAEGKCTYLREKYLKVLYVKEKLHKICDGQTDRMTKVLRFM